MKTRDQTLYTYTFTLWEKAEFWQFDVEVCADSDAEAFKQIKADYPIKEFSVRNYTRTMNV